MFARILPPRDNYIGNLLWRKEDLIGHEDELTHSLIELRSLGYWASAFPEGDGVTFAPQRGQAFEQVLVDFSRSFPWLVIQQGLSGDGNTELAELEEQANVGRDISCIVIVPLECVHLEVALDVGPFRFGCAREFQSPQEERLAECQGPYLQFETNLKYADLLRVGRSVTGDDVVINQCLSLAEHAMDVIRFGFSSFAKPQFTPNPAGQLSNGFFAIELIPLRGSHLKPVNLQGIARPMSASNNWLGPQLEDTAFSSRSYLEEVLAGRSDEMALAVKAALRGCRQSFYSLGDEAKFLNLVFTLDGLAHPKGTGWTQRTYIAALVSDGDLEEFARVLQRYDALYQIRNALVHKGRDFYEIGESPATSCQDLYDYVRAVVQLIGERNLTTVQQLRDLAKSWLSQSAWTARYQVEINAICNSRGIPVDNMPSW